MSYSELEKKIKNQKNQQPRMIEVLAYFLKKLGARKITLPNNFPYGYALALQKQKLILGTKPDPFYEERMIKTNQEKKAIQQSLKFTSEAIQEAYRVLRESKIKGNHIVYRGKVLTSELLKQKINLTLMKNNCVGRNTIVASGNQAVDPHCQGFGPIKPHQALVMDVFPKSMDSQYYADMTRTVVKGRASDKIRKQWHAVKTAQETAIRQVRAGMNGQEIHQGILDYFENQGYPTGNKKGRMQGFFHGTGHGLGLDIHEAPRISKVKNILQTGNVVTVEPGLYYYGVGGVRIEDVVYVKKNGCEVLSHCPKILEIP
jgi:Xaa-Pro aminopeptidase